MSEHESSANLTGDNKVNIHDFADVSPKAELGKCVSVGPGSVIGPEVIVGENMLATEILSQMNRKKITSAFVYNQSNKRKTTGVIHIHNLLKNLK